MLHIISYLNKMNYALFIIVYNYKEHSSQTSPPMQLLSLLSNRFSRWKRKKRSLIHLLKKLLPNYNFYTCKLKNILLNIILSQL